MIKQFVVSFKHEKELHKKAQLMLQNLQDKGMVVTQFVLQAIIEKYKKDYPDDLISNIKQYDFKDLNNIKEVK